MSFDDNPTLSTQDVAELVAVLIYGVREAANALDSMPLGSFPRGLFLRELRSQCCAAAERGGLPLPLYQWLDLFCRSVEEDYPPMTNLRMIEAEG